jgi:hypothetical protein
VIVPRAIAMDDIGNLLQAILGELTGPRGVIWALGVVALILVRVAWELWRINSRGEQQLDAETRLDADLTALANEMRELRSEIRELIVDLRQLIERR